MKTFENLIERNKYLSKIEPFINKSVVKVLVGHRRVGKSYVLYQIINMIRKSNDRANIIYIDKEDIDFDAIRNYLQLNDFIRSRLKSDEKNYIFIDEVQMIKDFHITIKSLALNENNDIYITGCNSDMLSSDLANELGGRYVEFTIYSLSYLEFLQFHCMDNSDASLERYIHYGGLPYLKNLPLEQEVINEYLRSIYSTIILKDVIQRKNIRNSIFLEQLIKFLAGNVGNLFSSKSISDYLKGQKETVSPNQVQEYVRALSDAFVIIPVERYDIAGKRHFETGAKYYFENLGIRNIVAGYKPQDRARRLENIVLNHLLFCDYKVKVGVLATEEVDFVCEKNGEKLYVQVTLELSREETIHREFGNLLRIKDNYPKIVVSSEHSFENSYEGVQHIHVRNFLSMV
jgi:predicted AAA+ superfamily ATPase